MLSVQNVNAGYGDNQVLWDVSVSVASGQFAGLIGPNGCGKTTLLRVVGGILPPASGKVIIQGADLRDIGRRTLARILACLPQDLSVDLAFTVREVTLMGRSPHLPRLGAETRKDHEIAERALELADVCHVADHLINEISGGERQRAFIAMCLAQEPELLLLDEPTTHLDIGHQLSLLDLIRTLNRETGMTGLAVFHDLNLAAEYCDALFMLDAGRLEASGPPEHVLTEERIRRVYRTNILVEKNPVSRKPHVVIAAGLNRSERQWSQPGADVPHGGRDKLT